MTRSGLYHSRGLGVVPHLNDDLPVLGKGDVAQQLLHANGKVLLVSYQLVNGRHLYREHIQELRLTFRYNI